MFNAKSMKRNIAYFECDTTKYIQVNVIVFYKGFLNSGIKKCIVLQYVLLGECLFLVDLNANVNPFSM